MSQACSEWRGDIGAYIVGALEHGGAANVRRHLRACAACRSEYEDLLPVRDWLMRPGMASTTAAARRRMGGPVLRLVRPPGGRTGRRWLVAAVAAVVAAAVGVVSSVAGSTAPSAFQAGNHATGVHGQARLHPTAQGTRINLTVTGLPAHERCRLVAVSRRGTDVAATWNASYDGSARIVGTSAISEDQMTALRVESASNRLLLTIALTGSRG
jgi:urease accessory protein UreF